MPAENETKKIPAVPADKTIKPPAKNKRADDLEPKKIQPRKFKTHSEKKEYNKSKEPKK